MVQVIEPSIFCMLINVFLLVYLKVKHDNSAYQNFLNNVILMSVIYCVIDCIWVPIYCGVIKTPDLTLHLVTGIYYLFIVLVTTGYVVYAEYCYDTNIFYKLSTYGFLAPLGVVSLLIIGSLITKNSDILLNILIVVFTFIPLILYGVISAIDKLRGDIYCSKRYGIISLQAWVILLVGYALSVKFPTQHTFVLSCTICNIYLSFSLSDKFISIDALTNLQNRSSLESDLHKAICDDVETYVVMIDIDRFKEINDKYGHAIGDDALRVTADTLSNVGRDYNFNVYRYGGDEFFILADNTSPELIIKFYNEVKELLRTKVAKKCYNICISLGYAYVDSKVRSVKDAIQAADKNMYEVKEKHHKTIGMESR